MTSSYSSRCLRVSKLRPSTCFCARSIDAGDHAVLDRDALLHSEAPHDVLQAVRPEDAHQVVFEREVEAGGARVALPARTAAELVVDAARLVALGADDVEPAGREDRLLVRGAALAGASRAAAPAPPGPRRPGSSWAATASGLPPRTMSVPRPAMFVAIVTEPERPAWTTISASFSWNLALRTTCGTLRFFRSSDSRSDFSIETVPTRTGWPFSRQLDDLVGDGFVLLAFRGVDDVLVVRPDHGHGWSG